jgi:hypothetical protein
MATPTAACADVDTAILSARLRRIRNRAGTGWRHNRRVTVARLLGYWRAELPELDPRVTFSSEQVSAYEQLREREGRRPDPRTLVDPGWREDERSIVIEYLRTGSRVNQNRVSRHAASVGAPTDPPNSRTRRSAGRRDSRTLNDYALCGHAEWAYDQERYGYEYPGLQIVCPAALQRTLSLRRDALPVHREHHAPDPSPSAGVGPPHHGVSGRTFEGRVTCRHTST